MVSGYSRFTYLLKGTFGHVHVSEVMNKAAVFTHVQVLCGREFLISLNRHQRARLWDHMKTRVSFCKKLTNCFPKWLYHVAFKIELGDD